MNRFLILCSVLVSTMSAVPLTYNNNAWYSGLDPYLVGKRENFMIQGVTVDAIKDANGFTGEFQAVLKFNYGGESPSIGNLSTINPYSINAGGVVSTLYASDLFFKQSGVIRYGVPLVDHGGPGPINGKSVGIGVFDDGDLYQVAGGIQTLNSTQFLTTGTNLSTFGNGRTVWLTSSSANPTALQTGTTQITFNGPCIDDNAGCNHAEYTVTLNMNGAPIQGSQWYSFLAGISSGAITPYFTGSACGNDLLDAAIPEPSTWLMLSGGLGAILFRARRRN
ncbi:MAG: PEP-CTERM sorting domain-containing protein [Acidobacteria bacterium]|nr:PEP-CTERM sorting domain-containing protein [Acidobacteriota bacterium]